MRYTTDASIIDERHLIPLGIWMKRGVAIGLWSISLIGTYILFNKGIWAWPFTPSALTALAIAFVYQLVFSAAQFSWRNNWFNLWYISALMASVVPSTLTYGYLITPKWTTILTDIGIPNQTIANAFAWFTIFCIMVGVDAIPEQILVKRKQTQHARYTYQQKQQIRQNYQGNQQSTQQTEDLLRDLLSQENR